MAPQRLAAWLDSYGVELRAGLATAAEQGYGAVQANTSGAWLDPAQFAESARRHLRRHLRDLGLELDGLALEYPGAGLNDPQHADERIERFRKTLALCADLGVRRAAVSVGALADEQRGVLGQQVLAAIADLSDRYAVDTAVRTPDLSPGEAARRLATLGCPNLHLALDTGAPGAAAGEALGAVRSVYLRDVRRTAGTVEEVPFGEGEVDFAGLLGALAVAAPQASFVVRHDGPRGVDALRQGREYIRSLLGPAGPR